MWEVWACSAWSLARFRIIFVYPFIVLEGPRAVVYFTSRKNWSFDWKTGALIGWPVDHRQGSVYPCWVSVIQFLPNQEGTTCVAHWIMIYAIKSLCFEATLHVRCIRNIVWVNPSLCNLPGRKHIAFIVQWLFPVLTEAEPSHSDEASAQSFPCSAFPAP